MRLDLHQHIWTEPLIDALAQRDQLPLIRVQDGLTVLHSHGEQPWPIDPGAENGPHRSSQLQADGIDRAVIAISSPVGFETLPRRQALRLIGAHLSGVAALGDDFRAWGAIALVDPDPEDVDELVERGCVGVSIPAGALCGPDRINLITPILARIEALDLPLLVHPGRAPGQVASGADLGEPPWWRALTDYNTQLHTAWLTFAAFGRRQLPRLRIVFAALAGGAPFSAERLLTRGGPSIDLRDPRVFYDTSSYGSQAVAAVARLVGKEQIVYGSDRSVVNPIATGDDERYQRHAAALFPDAEASGGGSGRSSQGALR